MARHHSYALTGCLRATTMVTAMTISAIPTQERAVRCSPNNVKPTYTAVIGSIAPRIAVWVDPIVWIARVVNTREREVGKRAEPTL